MRTDLNKVLCERERRGANRNHRPYRRMKKFAPDLDPVDGGPAGQEGMTYRYGRDAKDFDEHLSPLYGQIRKAVGKPWNKFYSELCKVFDKRSVINQHILGHLRDFCEKDLYEKDGKLYVKSQIMSDLPLEEARCDFYVDPKDGIIKKNKHKKTYRQRLLARRLKEEKEKVKVYIPISDIQALGKIGGIWFVLDIEEIPEEGAWDVYLGKNVKRSKYYYTSNRQTFLQDDARTYHARKRTASKKILKKYLTPVV